MSWQSVRDNPPQTVGRYDLKNENHGTQFPVQWDGRDFRYVDEPGLGEVVARCKGDQWRSIEGEQ